MFRGWWHRLTSDLIPVHAVVVVECWQSVQLADLPLSSEGVPISYFSSNDFLNLIEGLWAFPEIVFYLEQRALLPAPDRATVGGERVIYARYLQNEGGFAGWTNFNEMHESHLAR